MAQPANHLVLTQERLHDIELDLDHYNQLFDDLHAAAIIPNGNGDDAAAEDVRHEEDDNIKLIRSLQDLRTSVIRLSTFDGTQDVPDWLEDFTIILSKLVAIPMTTNAMTWSPISLVMPNLQPQPTKDTYATLPDALLQCYKPTNQKIYVSAPRYVMKQSPVQSFKDFAKQKYAWQGNCCHLRQWCSPFPYRRFSHGLTGLMEALLKLPVVVTEIAEEPTYSTYKLEDIKTKVNWLASAHQAQPSAPPKCVCWICPMGLIQCGECVEDWLQ